MSGKQSAIITQALAIWRTGATIRASAREAGCSMSGLARALRRAGEPLRPAGRRPKKDADPAQPG